MHNADKNEASKQLTIYFKVLYKYNVYWNTQEINSRFIFGNKLAEQDPTE